MRAARELSRQEAKAPTSVAEAFTSPTKLLGSVDAQPAIPERATCRNCGKKLEAELKTLTVERDVSRKALEDLTNENAEKRQSAEVTRQSVNAQVEEAREGHGRELNT